MRHGLELVDGPLVEPVSTADIKVWCRVDHTDEDDLLDALVKAARRRAELETGLALITQTWRATYDHFPAADGPLTLPLPPLQEVTEVEYEDTAGDTVVLDPDLYVVDTSRRPARLALVDGESWPDTLAQVNAVRVTFVAGFGDDPGDVPEEARVAIKLLAGHWYRHREEVQDLRSGDPRIAAIPMGARALLLGEWTGQYV